MPSSLTIELEGLDGAGKSTQVELLQNRLEHAGHPTQILRSPGGSSFGEAVRPVFLSEIPRPPETDLLLMAGLMAANLNQVKENAANDIHSILDRGVSSFYAYEGALGIPLAQINTVMNLINAQPGSEQAPDIHIVLDIDWQTSHKRLTGAKLDAWEKRGAEFFTRVRELYLRAPYGETIIDASKDVETVHEQIWEIVKTKLEGTQA